MEGLEYKLEEISQKVEQMDGEMENERKGKISGPVQEVHCLGVPEREEREKEGKEIITTCFKRTSPN